MRNRYNLSNLPVGLLALIVAPAFADFPYNPTRILLPKTDHGSFAYVFSPQPSSQFQLSTLDYSTSVDASNPSLKHLYTSLPFLSTTSKRSFIPISSSEDDTITVLVGDCTTGAGNSETWRFTPEQDNSNGNGTWSRLGLSEDSSQNTNTGEIYGSSFLSAGLSFSPTASSSDESFYVFGGMCGSSSSTASDWTSSASYSNNVLALSPSASRADTFTLKVTSTSRAAPIPEAGLSITPLAPTFSNDSSSNPSQNQNFVLIGGHTQSAFINMSQVALLSLPESSWTYLGIDPASDVPQDELARSSNVEVEPRSGHTAVLTPDGSRIIVLGGWVGDANTPATPQLAILEVGAGYGGSGDWQWSIPSATTSFIRNGGGLYGHGATILPGDVMMVTGGYSIPGSGGSRFRQRTSAQVPNAETLLFNTTSLEFIPSYGNPRSSSSSPDHSSTGLLSTKPQKVGLGTGLALGFSAVAGVVGIYFWYSRKMRRRRRQRESELRELALGAHRYYHEDNGPDEDHIWNEKSTDPSHGSIKRKPAPTNYPGTSNPYPWAPSLPPDPQMQINKGTSGSESRSAERTGLLVEIPSPTRGLRRSLHGRPIGYTPAFAFGSQSSPFGPGHGPHASVIHPIDEQDEEDEDPTKSIKKSSSAKSLAAANRNRPKSSDDPFRDPPPENLQPSNTMTSTTETQPGIEEEINRSPSKEKRDRNAEIQGWVDDWTAAAADMNLSHNNSVLSRKSHTHSHSQSNSQSYSSGRGSPEKSDRTGSNLSEASMLSTSSLQRSNAGSILARRDGGRSVSMTSSAQNLFAGAAAAMAAGVAGSRRSAYPGTPDRRSFPAAKQRSSSYGTTATATARDEISASRTMQGPYPRLDFSPRAAPWEKEALLRSETDHSMYVTPPESPIKDREVSNRDRANSLGGAAGRKALGFLGSVKRALTGGVSGQDAYTQGGGAVKKRIAEYEEREKDGSPSTYSYWANEPRRPGLGGSSEETVTPRRAASASAAFWRGKKGRKDWDENDEGKGERSSKAMLAGEESGGKGRASGEEDGRDESDDEGEWDVEGAVQRRVVQVMFTVPKERLRVVNCDVDGNSVATVEAVPGGELATEEDGQAIVQRQDKGKGKEKADE
ncbi:MAG: hypothetical protein Q9227_005909 [Pyrenula ochraceoflavens]